MKRCGRCHETKPVSEFYVSPKGQAHSYCRPCYAEYQRAWRKANPEAQRAAEKRWAAEHPEEIREAKRRRYHARLEHNREMQRRWRERNPERVAEYQRRHKERWDANGLWGYYEYGLTLEQRRALEAVQDHACPLCGRLLKGHRPQIDHDHATGKVRGILCGSCNARLGWYESRIEQVAAYLAAPSATQLE